MMRPDAAVKCPSPDKGLPPKSLLYPQLKICAGTHLLYCSGRASSGMALGKAQDIEGSARGGSRPVKGPGAPTPKRPGLQE